MSIITGVFAQAGYCQRGRGLRRERVNEFCKDDVEITLPRWLSVVEGLSLLNGANQTLCCLNMS
jgi:hypothetical protein